MDRRVYEAIQNLPEFFKEKDLSRAVVLFINSLVNPIGECAERTAQCERLLVGIIGREDPGKVVWN